MFTQIIDWLLPPKIKILVRAILSRFIGFSAVDSWDTAVSKSVGYEANEVIYPIVQDALQLQHAHETATFTTSRYQQIASGILYCITQLQKNASESIRVLDVGGGGADYYYQLQRFAPQLNVEWTVLETPALVKALTDETGLKFSNLKWVDSLEKTEEAYDVVLCSSVLQYLEKPWDMLSNLTKKSQFIVINRIPLVNAPEHFTAVQRIFIRGKRGSYPAHFFSEERFLNQVTQYGEITMRWHVLEDQPVIDWKAQPNHGIVLKINR